MLHRQLTQPVPYQSIRRRKSHLHQTRLKKTHHQFKMGQQPSHYSIISQQQNTFLLNFETRSTQNN